MLVLHFVVRNIFVMNIRLSIKSVLPIFIRRILGCFLHYNQRLFRWIIILIQVRGEGLVDTIKLILSAVAAPVLCLRNLSVWQDPILLFNTKVRVPGIGRFELRHHTDDLWHVLPWREDAIVSELRSRLHSNNIFIDAGANIGVYTILASHLVGDGGKVIAIEMMPDTAAILRRHVILNSCNNVFVVEKALSSRAGEIIVAKVTKGKYGQASITTNWNEGVVDSFDVETTTLDAVCDENSDIDLMKMDLEGAEAQALAGSSNTLPKIKAVILETLHNDTDKAAALLKKNGFILKKLTGKDHLALRT